MNRLTLGRVPARGILIVLVVGFGGCSACYGPDRSVQVVLRGASDSARWQATETLLPRFVDDPTQVAVSWSSSGQGPPEKVQLGPVADPKAFADRIRFGRVEKIEGRTVYLEVDEGKAQTVAVIVKVVQFIEDLPNTVRRLLFFGHIKVLAWWTGEPESEVFWSEVRRILTVPW